MQSLKRTISPVTWDAYLQETTAHRKIYTPGERLTGVIRIKQGDVGNVGRVWVDLVGEQMTTYGDQMINPELRPFQQMEKTFFRVHQDVDVSPSPSPSTFTARNNSNSKIMGEFAYFNFAVEIPAYDQFVPAGLPVAVGGNRDEADANTRKPLPPSMVVQPKLAVRPRAYNRYYAEICIEVQNQRGRTLSRTLPFLLLPLDPTPPEPFTSAPAPWLSPGCTKTDQEPQQTDHDHDHDHDHDRPPPPPVPAGWTKYRPNEVWDLRSGKEENKAASGGWLRGWLSRKDRNLEEQQPKVEVRVVLAVPPIQSWPRNQPIPFHLTATATASSPYSSTTSTSAPPPTPPTDIDLSDLVLNFQLFQKIRVVAKGSYEDYDTVRQSSAVAPEKEKGQEKGQENVENGGDHGNGLVSGSAKYRSGDFSVHAPDQWATEWRRSESGGGDANAWVSEKVVVGSFKVGMLPSFVNGGLSIKYGLKLELLLLSTLSKQTFSLVQPVISSGLHRGGLPAYDDNEEGEADDGGLVPPAYWDIEDLGGGKNE